MIGVGGGIVVNTYCSLMTDMPQHEIVATSLMAFFPVTITGSLAHYVAGTLHVRAAIIIGAAALCSAGAVSRVVSDIDEVTLRRIFAVVLAASSLNMLMKK